VFELVSGDAESGGHNRSGGEAVAAVLADPFSVFDQVNGPMAVGPAGFPAGRWLPVGLVELDVIPGHRRSPAALAGVRGCGVCDLLVFGG
jgi:hypothetical protein